MDSPLDAGSWSGWPLRPHCPLLATSPCSCPLGPPHCGCGYKKMLRALGGLWAFFSFFLFFFINLFIYFRVRWVFVAARAFSSCRERGLLFVVVRGLLIAVASLVVEHGL